MKFKLVCIALLLAVCVFAFNLAGRSTGEMGERNLAPSAEISETSAQKNPPIVPKVTEDKKNEMVLASAQALLESSKARKQRLAEKMKEWEQRIPRRDILNKVIENRVNENSKLLTSWGFSKEKVEAINNVVRQRDFSLQELRASRLKEPDSAKKALLLAETKAVEKKAQTDLSRLMTEEQRLDFETWEKTRSDLSFLK